MKRTACALVTALLLTVPALPVNAATGTAVGQGITVTINDVKQAFDVNPIIENGRVMVPMRYVFEALGADMQWDQETQTVFAKKESKEIQVKIGSFFAKKNNDTILMDVKPRLVNGRTLVPLRFVSESLGAQVDWNPQTKAVTVSTAAVVADSKQNNTTEKPLTFNEALAMVLKQDYRLKSAKLTMERAEIVRDNIADSYMYSIPSGPGNGYEDLQRLQGLQALLAQDANLRVSNKRIDLAKETIEFELESMFDEIIDLEKQIKLKDLNLKDLKNKLDITKLKVETGTESKHKYSNDQKSYDQMLKEKEVLSKKLDSSYIKLNNLLGLKETERYTVEKKDASMIPVSDFDIDTHITRTLSSDPYLWIQEQTIKNYENALNLYTYNAGQEPYKAKELDLSKSKSDLANMKEKLRKSLLLKYNQLQQLEKQYAVTQSQVEQIQQNLEILRKQYDLGLITRMELDQVELSIAQLQYALDAMKVQHKNLKITLEKPYLAPDYV